MAISIREALPGDLEALIRFHGLFMAHHIDCDNRFSLRSGVKDKWRERICAAIDDSESLVLVAEEPPDFVGCA